MSAYADTSFLFSLYVADANTDVLHIATARLLGTADFVTFDTRQAALAKHVGLTVKP